MDCKCTCEYACKCKPTLDNEMPLKEMYKTALATRNLEIGMFWTRSNYFLVLNTALGFGFFSVFKNIDMNTKLDTYAILLLCFIGCVICLIWFIVNLGSKFWQSHWEEILEKVEQKMELKGGMMLEREKESMSFFKNDKCQTVPRVRENLKMDKGNCLIKFYKHAVVAKPSVSVWMTFLSLFFLIVWLVLFVCFLIKLATACFC